MTKKVKREREEGGKKPVKKIDTVTRLLCTRRIGFCRMPLINRKGYFFVFTSMVLALVICTNWYTLKVQIHIARLVTTNTDMAAVKTNSRNGTSAETMNHKEQPRYLGQISKATITPLQNRRTFIIAAYCDNREMKQTRVISIVHHEKGKELYCWLYCRARRGYLSIRRAVVDVHTDRYGFHFGAADVLCSEPPDCDPKYVSIHWSSEGDSDQLPVFEIQNRNPQPITANFTVCISTLFGNYNNVLQVIQTIEMYKLLGAQRVMIYKNNCSALLEHVLQYYIAEGTVEVIPWPIHEHLNTTTAWKYAKDPKDIGYYGQQTTLNDCIYRNMYRSQYVVLNDLDEIILPYKHHNWSSMMESLQKRHPNIDIFLFENHIFPRTTFMSTDEFNTSFWSSVPGDDILQHVQREPDRPHFFNAKKMILNPRKVIQTSVHTVLKAHGKSRDVPMDEAITYHCRGPLQASIPKTSLIKDTTIWKYSRSLIRNVSEVLKKTKIL